MKHIKNLIIGCDWGTSFFRLRVIDSSTNSVLAELTSEDGIAKTNKKVEKESDRFGLFCEVISENLDALKTKVDFEIDSLTIVLSGMASSSIGMKELPYGHLPFGVRDAFGLDVEVFENNASFPNPLILISGLRDKHDVMRGEEVQLLGLAHLMEFSKEEETIIILPGTHSKHCFVKNGVLNHFQTYLTGELYQILSEYSILSNSVTKETLKAWTPKASEAFSKGVLDAKDSSMLVNLFKVRTNFLFSEMDKPENALYLSGLLIGEELGNISLPSDSRPIILCGGENMNVLYKKAVEALGIESRTQFVADDILIKSTIAGQSEVFKIHNKKLND
ncbi:2-dehydro-3-deoxygalactonokinase [Arcticibacterium luteifluviistationis]|uniref:2-keto-3-deoxy-galactonokinase n=1 Tax=Arcticibacterium luteifluviistationis TaxID=1784714 RepID=A0A2Z4GDS8_9BACT|nr:2-dehydro-3-deoxygalactonokinase [Arcticibacterium luteifluviistationis]AWV99301.1 2-keto-3-deoxy-galactonokinase [Arcticibacterium luteifluviistationis]